MSSVQYVIGNTYKRLDYSDSELDSTGQYHKYHDWILYVDIVSGNPDLIQRISFDLGSTFQPQQFICSSPISMKKSSNGKKFWRFKTRQQSYGPISAQISIVGSGGTNKNHKYSIQLGGDDVSSSTTTTQKKIYKFVENRPIRPLQMMKVSPEQKFGIELELTSSKNVDTTTIATILNDKLYKTTTVHVIDNYSDGKQLSTGWKFVPDSSIVCNVSNPNCNTFELVSPIQKGGYGLTQISRVLNALDEINPKLKVNKSMGYHVHIDVSELSLEQLIKICQNFIKYEDVMDMFLPVSRRTGSTECNKYFKSNRQSVQDYTGYNTNSKIHYALQRCTDIYELSNLMNNDGRYYKLNLQNLITKRQTSIEFRQHSATMNYQKVSAWIRFCIAFVQNSARLASPKSFKEGRTINFQFDALFQYVIKDRALRDYYRGRIQELGGSSSSSNSNTDSPPCCGGCATGGKCRRDQ